MTWYFTLFIGSVIIMLFQTMGSWLGADIDIDIDLDGDLDADGGSILSFKGIVHFVLGFSTVLCAFAANNIDKLHFTWWQYIIAVIAGIVCVIELYRLYKLIARAEHASYDNTVINGSECAILNKLNDTDDLYEVLVYTPSGTRKLRAIYDYAERPKFGVIDYIINVHTNIDDERSMYQIIKKTSNEYIDEYDQFVPDEGNYL